jgi:hypothetical protein
MDNENIILKASDLNISIELRATDSIFYSVVHDRTLWNLIHLGPMTQEVQSEPYKSFDELLTDTINKYPLFKLEPLFIDPVFRNIINSFFLWYVMNLQDSNSS